MKKEDIYRAFNVREGDLPCSDEELQAFMSMFEPVVIEEQILERMNNGIYSRNYC